MADFRWYGHNCFRIRAREGTIVTDPVSRDTGYTVGARLTADIVTVSHDHPGHRNLNAVKDPYSLIDGPGEYEIHEVYVYGHRAYHDTSRGAEHGYNTIFVFEVEGMRIAHLGDLGHDLTHELTDALDNIDVLLVPVGGGDGLISPELAARIVGQLEPTVVIPMQFATERGDPGRAPLDGFIQHLGVERPDPVDRLTVRHADLGETMTLSVLIPSGESA